MAIPLINAVNTLTTVLYVLLFARILMSWLPMFHGSRFAELLFALTEPILGPIRKLIMRSPLGGPGMVIDFSPIIAFVLLRLASGIAVAFIAHVFA